MNTQKKSKNLPSQAHPTWHFCPPPCALLATATLQQWPWDRRTAARLWDAEAPEQQRQKPQTRTSWQHSSIVTYVYYSNTTRNINQPLLQKKRTNHCTKAISQSSASKSEKMTIGRSSEAFLTDGAGTSEALTSGEWRWCLVIFCWKMPLLRMRSSKQKSFERTSDQHLGAPNSSHLRRPPSGELHLEGSLQLSLQPSDLWGTSSDFPPWSPSAIEKIT